MTEETPIVETVSIRYVGPMTEGLYMDWMPEYGQAFDFLHHEHPETEGDGFVDVPVALARELLDQREPIPPGDPVQIGTDEETGLPILEVPMRPVYELAPGATLPDVATTTDRPAKSARAARKSTTTRN